MQTVNDVFNERVSIDEISPIFGVPDELPEIPGFRIEASPEEFLRAVCQGGKQCGRHFLVAIYQEKVALFPLYKTVNDQTLIETCRPAWVDPKKGGLEWL